MKDPSGLLGQQDLTSRKMCDVVMQNSEPVPTMEYTEIMVKNLDSTYAKSYLEQVPANEVHINADNIIKLLSLLNKFEDLFDGTLG